MTTSGQTIGEHQGFARYTIGQRRRLPGGSALPLYVVGIRPEDRAVVVGTAAELEGRVVRLAELNWLAEPLAAGASCQVQIRYRSRAVPARIRSIESEIVTLDLEVPARAITPGQSGVLYTEAGQVLGGGVIE